MDEEGLAADRLEEQMVPVLEFDPEIELVVTREIEHEHKTPRLDQDGNPLVQRAIRYDELQEGRITALKWKAEKRFAVLDARLTELEG